MKRRLTLAVALSASLTFGTAAPAHADISRPVDSRSSVNPLLELSSPTHAAEHSSLATDAELDDAWSAAIRTGFFSPLIASIYGLQLEDMTWQEREAANAGKLAANPAATEVLGSSLRWDAARGRQFGTALNILIGGGVVALAAIVLGVLSSQTAQRS